MELSADEFERTLRQLKGCGGTRPVERRSGVRVGIRCRIHLRAVHNGKLGNPFELWTRDISTTGLGVMNSKRMKTGEHYLLSLARKEDDAQEQLVLYCTVSSCRELADGLFAIGFGFTALDPAKPEKSPVAPAPVLPVPPARPQPGGLRADEDEEGRIRDAILG